MLVEASVTDTVTLIALGIESLKSLAFIPNTNIRFQCSCLGYGVTIVTPTQYRLSNLTMFDSDSLCKLNQEYGCEATEPLVQRLKLGYSG